MRTAEEQATLFYETRRVTSRRGRDALAAAMKPGGLKLDNIVLLLTVDQQTAIGIAKDNDDVIASFRFAKMAGDAFKLTVTDLSGKRLAFAVDPLSKHLTKTVKWRS